MPKIVDHETHRREIAQRAAKFFSDHGYAGTSMRKVAEFLGLSKSALYHYFPTKKDLFIACTKEVMANLDTEIVDPNQTDTENLERLKAVLRPDFATEMALTFDYLRGKSPSEIATDEAMQVALETYLGVVATIVGEQWAEEYLARLLGDLMLEYMSGKGRQAP